jgi:hypothetical protein
MILNVLDQEFDGLKEKLRISNEYYLKEFLFEMNLNKRDNYFIQQLLEVCFFKSYLKKFIHVFLPFN